MSEEKKDEPKEKKPSVTEDTQTDNVEPKEAEVTNEDKQLDVDRDSRTVPVVKLVLKLLAEHEDLKLGSQAKPEEKVKVYVGIAEKLINEMLEQKTRLSEIKWIFDMLNDTILNLTNITERTMDSSSKKSTAHLYGAKDFDDITVNNVHKVLMDNKI